MVASRVPQIGIGLLAALWGAIWCRYSVDQSTGYTDRKADSKEECCNTCGMKAGCQDVRDRRPPTLPQSLSVHAVVLLLYCGAVPWHITLLRT